ncbi:MAG: amino acid adenylation domain-containing protein [Lewinellaceae bacterium]|nr:amino acid adenylation domain-containing protein [Saprospiraceae bacterium]MCB9339911.1 amino acid adenylation domain-containing protein [Lewinellaceae bacterium]
MNENKHVSNTISFPSDSCLHEIFRREARRNPGAIALVSGSESMTYAELDARSDELANQLLAAGIQPEDFVAIYLDRSFGMIVAIFAILKAGGAYVPIDVNYPSDRMAFMLEDARAKVLLTQTSLLKNIPTTQAKVICLDAPEIVNRKSLIVNRKSNPVSPANLAYMIYTSGSTGKPKGCMITHENVCNQLEGQQAIAPEPIGAMILTVSISFDVSVLTIFWTLLQGATLVLPKQGEEKDPAKLADIIHKNKVTHSMSLPSPYTLLLDQAPSEKLQSLRLVNVSGEVCPTPLAQKHEQLLPNCQLYNLYGPTEATVNCTYFTFPKGFDEPKVPIGIPILNYEIFILDENRQKVPHGEVGEIYIGGTKPVVGRGYWNRPELTAERFVQKPLHLGDSSLIPHPSSLYKTGDLARWQADGNIEFLGRSDFQVKYRGFRVELGEIETAVGHHPAVNETVVLLKNQHQTDGQRLVAYVTLHLGKKLSISELRSFLEKSLPEYMLPSHLVVLEKMPLTTNGKFDRQALPEPANDRPDLGGPYEAPQTELEKYLAEKWERLLQITPIGRHDKFFELGGNSILAAKFIGELMNATGASIFITTIFDHPTVAAYAAFLEKNYVNLLPGLLGKTAVCNPMREVAGNGHFPKESPDAEGLPNFKSLVNLSPEDIANFPRLVPNHLPPVASHESPVTNHQSPITNYQSPIFILAPPRSGTTLLRVMLAGHPGLFACNELQLLHFETLKERSEAYTGKFSLWTEGLIRAVMELKNLDADEARLLLNRYAEQGMTTVEMYQTLHDWLNEQSRSEFGTGSTTNNEQRTVVDKSPSYALDSLALAKALADFPNARFIHLVRHPYSMVRSFEKYHMDQVLYLHEHDFSAQQLGELVWLHSHRNTVDFLKKVPTNQQFRIVYEDLVKNPEQVMREMCGTLGLPFHENLLMPYRDLDKKMTDGIHHDSRSMGDTNFDQKKKIDARKAEDWKGVLEKNFLCDRTWVMAEMLGYEQVSDLRLTNDDLRLPDPAEVPSTRKSSIAKSEIAIIGMACRLPGANSIEEFWQNLVEAKDVSHPITDEDLSAEGIVNRKSSIVNRTYALTDSYAFDATFFGYHPKEAEMTDPQHRIFLETAYEALESAGYDPYRFEGNIGVFGGVARNTYFTNNLLTNKELLENSGGWYQDMLASDSTFSISRVAYKLNLRGSAVNVQTACSTGGVAVHLACQSLLAGDSDMVIVGGGRIQAPVYGGYEHIEGGPLSPDGVCRAFDEKANGMVQGHGMAMLVLKKLDKAIEDGDHIWAVIKSSAVNNDGSDKTGITAPSARGQAAVIKKAIERAGLTPDHISYIETHGTGTFIGDPIEMQGLMFGMRNEELGMNGGHNHPSSLIPHPCLIGSVKTNIGHLDAGAGIVGIIKTALSLYHEQLPATMHFTSPNPQIDFKNSPFEVNAVLRPWPRCETPRRAGVSTFGLGGTNAHIILEEAPAASALASDSASAKAVATSLLLLSAKTEQALEKSTAKLLDFFEKHPKTNLSEAAYTLAVGRPHFSKRKALIATQFPNSPIPNSQFPTGHCEFHDAPITFLFPGGGAQYVDMARDLYETNGFFKKQVDACFEILEKHHGLIVRDLVYPEPTIVNRQSSIENPSIALTSLFTIEYSLAKLWQHWGIQPAQLMGHSMGEYTAACLAGVMSLEDALGLVTVRGRLFETLDGNGGMLSVALTEENLRPYLDAGHTISVINKVDSLVVSGTAEAIDRLQTKLVGDGIDSSRIHINVAAHSPQVEPILPAFKKYLETVELHEPQIPIVSNVTGTWMTPQQATSVDYWLSHLRQTVRFADGLNTLLTQSPITNYQSPNKNRIFLEVGPGQTLSTFTRAVPTLSEGKNLVLASVRHPKEVQHDVAFILKTLAKLWVNGVEVNWAAVYENEKRRRIPLPTYPFEKRKFFIAPKQVQPIESQLIEVKNSFAGQFYTEPANLPAIQSSNELTMNNTQTRIPILVDEIKQSLHELSGLEPEAMDEQASFLELGFDSLFLSQAVIKFNHKFKLDLSFRMLFEDAPSIAALAEYVDGAIPAELFQPKKEEKKAFENQPISIENGQNGNSISTPQMSMAGLMNFQNLTNQDSPVQQLIQQQLQIMQQQLALLQGGVVNPNPVSTPSANSTQAAATNNEQPTTNNEIPRPKGVTAKLNSYKKITGGDDLTERQRKGLDDFMRRYAAMTQQSKELAQRHRQWYADPRSVTGFSKLWKEICYQIAHERSKGSKIWDVDGNEYVDYVMSYGVALFGHMPDFVEEAVAAALKRGNSIDLLPPEATEVARIICELSGHDRATLANTGTEAVLGAVRAARTATGRDKIAVFDTDYHGMIDQFMVRGIHLKGESKTLPSSPGVPKFLVENTLVFDYDDPEVLQKLEKHIHKLAAVVIEPVQAQNPHWQHPELIRSIRQLTENHGVALIFDEIINGFRLHQQGAQAWYGVEADLCAYGKSISGGLPLAAVAGKAKFMEAFDGGPWNYGDDSSPDGVIAYFASTFIKNPISVAAAHAALREIERLGPAMQQALNEKTARFAERIREIFLRTKAPLMIQACSSFFMIKNADNSPLTRLFNYFLRARGVNIRERPCFISTAHTEADFEKTYTAFELAIHDMFEAGLMEAWEGEDLNVIVSPLSQPLPPEGGPQGERSAELGRGGSPLGDGCLSQPLSQPLTSEGGPQGERSAELGRGGSPLGDGGWGVLSDVPLTEGQLEIFLSSQISTEASKAYNIATEIRLEGDVDVEKLRMALQTLVDRHEALRTVFSEDGRTQRVLPALKFEIPFVELTPAEADATLQELHDEEAEHLFDLQNGPLVRFKIVKMAERVHLVFIHVHHIICDGWSLGILTRELGEIYAAGLLNFESLVNLKEPKQLSQYASEQADLQRLEVFQKNENYWLGQFAYTVPVLDLPTDFLRPPVKTFPGAVEKISLEADFVKQLRKAAARQGSTFYVFMLAAYQAYLARISGQDDFVVGVAAAGHNLPGNANLVAHAIGLLPVRTKVDGNATFSAYLKTVRKQVLDAFDHQQYTFGALVKKLKISRSASRNTLVSVAFNLDSPLDDLSFGGLKATTRAIPRHYETFDTFINLKPLGEQVDFEWNFNTDLFRRESIRFRLVEFERFLHGLVEELETPIARLPLLPDFERRQLATFGQGEKADFPLHRCLHELFEMQAEKTPDKKVVLFENQSLTYRELNGRANKLAEILKEKDLQPGSFVGLCMDRSLEMMVSIYAILKAGGAYVPIDPRNPKERIQLILEDANCTHLLTLSEVMKNLPVFNGEILFVESLDLIRGAETLTSHVSPLTSDTTAYVIYTSGSTGTPKGVAISHRNAVNTLFAINKHLEISGKDKVYSVSSMSFDMSIPDYFLTLMQGATLILAGEETKKDGFALRESLERHRPTLMQATPTTWKILMLAGWQGDKNLTAIAGGEGFPKDLAGEMAACCKAVWNGYGPTETTIYATYQRITEEHLAACPGEFAAIGSPIANTEMVILDKNGEPAPIGVPGELFIGGEGVAAGYLNREELTDLRFTILDLRLVGENLQSSIVNRKYYRTGDLVRYLPGGEIEFLGRIDNQVKIRGYRVELGEIEETIKQFPGVANAAVAVFSDKTGSQQLVGYVVWANQQQTTNNEQLKSFLHSKLPGFMVPSIFVEMDELPMNSSLKVDRQALPKPDLSSLSTGRFEAPKTPGEKLLAEVWKELLGVEKVGIHDDFFELGGHSLAAVQMMSKVKAETGVKLPLTTLFQNSTVEKLAVQLNGFNHKEQQDPSNGHDAENQEFTSLIPIREGGSKPPLYLVHGGGLHVLFYQNLVKYLDDDQPIFALQARGLNGDEEPLDRIEEMAAHYIREMLAQNQEGPYCLAGYSLGGLIAWEMAKQLQEMGKEVPLLSLFDAVAKYEWAGDGGSAKWKKLFKKAGFNLSLMLRDPAAAVEYKKHVLKMNFQHQKGKLRIAYRNNATHEIEEGYLPYGSEVYEKSLEAYDKYELQPLDIQVDLFKAKEQMFYLHDPEFYGWDKFAKRGVVVHEIEGNHLTLFDEPNGKAVAAILEKRLGEIHETTTT